LLYAVNAGHWRMFIGNGAAVATTAHTTGTTVTAGWHHIAGTYDGADLKIYIDGSEVIDSRKATTIGFQTTGIQQIGAIYDTPTRTFFDGQLTDVQIDNVALSGNRIRQIYQDSAQFYF